MKALNTIATMAFFLVNCATVDGQSRQHYKQNPYSLVYEGAITKNEKGSVNIHPVK